MYAIFKAQGKQFRAVEDAVLRIPSLEAEPGETVTFGDVLLAEQDGDVHVGAPCVAGASVAAEVVSHGRGDKIIVYKMKRRKGYRRKQGHRQGYTEIRILGIDLPGEPQEAVAKPAAAAPKAAPKAEAAPESQAAEPAPVDDPAPVDITPVARKLAEEHGLDLGAIEGTGKDGRILKSDVDKAIAAKEGD
ncbi:MAG: 50S ribosomal protein L21 [Gemmatimonadales bacterium]|nr:50S ribosomal protein L21 [Gemmatimonadales bacterium]MYG19207.1 50S ribosomal protein L21 [Gemmatimonadales bacterium]MYH10307.1 50S ribosomal protein L21 [Gemmatimonadales bacterium]MYL05967.1 50S ribosomal protein L21 [Gemmatimonadales bacterium]